MDSGEQDLHQIKSIAMLFKKYSFAILILVSFQNLLAQNNGIYNGGNAAGWTSEGFSQVIANSIFSGGQGQGYFQDMVSMQNNSLIYAGGPSDGNDLGRFSHSTNGRIFAGGQGDGDEVGRFEKETNNSIFAGGIEDGYDKQLFADQTHGEIFVGGSDDGYSSSGLSKLIWTGAVNKDWLVAGNWNLSRPPNRSDQAVIASGAPRYPALNGKLQIGTGSDYTYVCNSLLINSGAELNGNSNSWFVNDIGIIDVSGTMTFYKNPDQYNLNKRASILKVTEGGKIHIIE